MSVFAKQDLQDGIVLMNAPFPVCIKRGFVSEDARNPAFIDNNVGDAERTSSQRVPRRVYIIMLVQFSLD
jgi:hypothetical protein